MIKITSTVTVFLFEKSGDKASDCKIVSDIEERRLILSRKKLWFNCTRTNHQASLSALVESLDISKITDNKPCNKIFSNVVKELKSENDDNLLTDVIEETNLILRAI